MRLRYLPSIVSILCKASWAIQKLIEIKKTPFINPAKISALWNP